jgi:hypothetical protein
MQVIDIQELIFNIVSIEEKSLSIVTNKGNIKLIKKTKIKMNIAYIKAF